ncbi:MAG: tetratricopeptide repeat protein [Deltaproteobacteria bacterium]|nr:tetratricopeptide repeat protein [Deltaproteobacteria bacterium]
MDNHRQIFREGRRFFEKKEYEKAEKCFVSLLKANEKFADVHNMLGVIYHANGQFTRSIECFEKAIKINPHYTEALLNLAVLYNDLGKYKKALALYDKVTPAGSKKKKEKIDPFIKNKLANKHADLGEMYEGVGLYTEAISEFEKALALRPQFLDIRSKLGICLREEGQHKEAIKIFNHILKENPKYTHARVQLGVTYFAQGENKKALETWNQALKQNPKDEAAKMYLKLVNGHSTSGKNA